MTEVLQRFTWHGEPKALDDCFRLVKGSRRADCRLQTHQFGWELRLEIDEELRTSQVCRSQEEVFATYEGWRAALLEKGWTTGEP